MGDPFPRYPEDVIDGDEPTFAPTKSDHSLLAAQRGTHKTKRLETDADNNLYVNVAQGSIDVTVGEVEVKNDAGNPVPVSGTVSVDNLPAVQPVSDNGGSLTVDGSVSVGNFPASQAVTGPLTNTELRASAVPVSIPTPVPVTDNSGSLTIDGTVAATQSGIWQSVPNRPSQGVGRTYKHGVASAITSDTTVYTVTNGKTLYVTNIDLSAFNTSTTNAGRIDIKDGSTIIQTISMSTAGVGTLATAIPASVASIVFIEPLQFSTDVSIDIVTGTITCSFCFTGYEE